MSEAPPRRRVWPWLLAALLLLLLALLLLALLAPAAPEARPVAYSPRDRLLVVLTGEGGWAAFVVAVRRFLARHARPFIGNAARVLARVVLVAGIVVGAAAGWLGWKVLSAEIHGVPSGHHHHRDWD